MLSYVESECEYAKEEGIKKGIKEGKEEGKREEKKQVILNMYKKHINIEVICEIVNLPQVEVEEIIKYCEIE